MKLDFAPKLVVCELMGSMKENQGHTRGHRARISSGRKATAMANAGLCGFDVVDR